MKKEGLDWMPVVRFTPTMRRSARLQRAGERTRIMKKEGSDWMPIVRFTPTKRRSARLHHGGESALEQKSISPLLSFVSHEEESKVNSARDFVFWRFDVGCLLEQNLLEGFLKRLQQTRLLSFFEKTCEVIAPRELIVDFLLQCKVEWVSSAGRKLTYSLQVMNMPVLRIEVTRDLFAHILQLPEVRSGGGPLEYGTLLQATLPSSKFGEKVEWLGEEYCGSMCSCSNYNKLIGKDGFSKCASCSSNSPESYWITNEIKDPSIRDLFHFIGLWIHNTNDTSCLRRAAVVTLCEALSSQTGNQVWTQHLWTNFLWDLEKVREHAERNRPYECHFNTAGLISTIICAHVRRSQSWIPAFRAWESSALSPGMMKCKLLLKQLHMSEGDEQGLLKRG